MRIIFFFIIMLLTLMDFVSADEYYLKQKQIELEECSKLTMSVLTRIRAAQNSRAGDYLKLLPDITVSKRSPVDQFEQDDIYLGVSFSTSSIFDIADRYKERKKEQQKALRSVQSLSYKTKKLIHKKYQLMERIWKLKQMRKSTGNPVEISSIDEKIDTIILSVTEIEIDIEKAYAEIEFLCVEVVW